MKVLMHTGGVASTNCFVVADEQSSVAVLFDAPDHSVEPLLQQVKNQGWSLAGLWLTHGHFDHFADHSTVKKQYPGAQILIHKLDADKARQPERQTRMFGLPFTIAPLEPTGFVEDLQVLRIGSLEVQVMHTPGHSPGHVCYSIPKEKLLIGGDLIIGGSVGRTDLPESNHIQLEASIRRVMALPGDTRLLGGHGPASTLEQERATNYFVQEVLENG